MTRRRTITEKTFVETAEKALDKGLTPDQALDAASEVAYGHTEAANRELPALVKQQLGLDDPETSDTFGKLVTKRYMEAELKGIFPAWIEEVEDPTDRAKLKMDYLKSHKQTMADALVTKKEKHIHEGDYSQRTDEDLKFFKEHGYWPKTIDGPPSVN